MAAIPSTHPANADLSADERWWWNGEEWVTATSQDGLWRWDGSEWRQAREFPESDPGEIASRVQDLADDHFAAAGHILVHRFGHWVPGPTLGEAVRRAEELGSELAALERELTRVETQAGHGLTAVIARLSGLDDERSRLGRQRHQLRDELRAVEVEIGRRAPDQVLVEAEDDLSTARQMRRLADEIASARAGHVAAETEWRGRVAAAEEELRLAQARRERALAGARAELSRAEAEWQENVSSAWRDLARARMPGPGVELAHIDDLVLYERAVVTPQGRGRVADIEARIAPVADLRAQLGDELDEMFEMEASGVGVFHEALAGDDSTPFLFVRAGGLRALVPIAQRPEVGRDMLKRIKAASASAREGSARRRESINQLEAARARAVQDRTDIESASKALTKAERDPSLLRPVEAANEAVERARAQTDERDSAWQRLQDALTPIRTPPAPLGRGTS